MRSIEEEVRNNGNEVEEHEEEESLELTTREPIIIDVVLTPRTPILMHKPTIVDPLQSTSITKQYTDEWRETAYTDPDGFLCIPDTCIEAMIRDASKSRKIGKHYLKKYIVTDVTVAEQYPRFLVKGKPVTLDDVARNNWVDVQGAVVGKSRITRRRVRLSDYELSFTLKLDSPLITPEVLKEVLIHGSTNQGLLDQRPSSPNKPGKFGQFFVTKFEF